MKFEIIKKLQSKILTSVLVLFILFLIIYLAYFIRLKTAYVDIPLDYDPWWFFRHARDIVERWDKEKKFILSSWDILSYFPPGRPLYYDGYSYTIALSYIFLRNFLNNISLEKFSVYFVAVFSALTAIPAFFLAKTFTKSNLAGLLAALIISISPAFLTVSMAGYVDSDVVYVFYTYLTILSTVLLIEKFFENKIDIISKTNLRKIINLLPYFLFSIISYILFAWNWSSAYYFLFIIIGFIIFYSLIVNPLHMFLFKKRSEYKNIKTIILRDFFNLIILLSIVILSVEIITTFIEKAFETQLPKPISTILSQIELAIKGGLKHALLVNISVAELQILNPFSAEGIKQIAARVGLIPFILSLLIFPISAYNYFIRKIVNWKEIFLLIWFIYSLYLISQGIRFSLLFSISLAIVSSYSIISLYTIFQQFIQKNEKILKIFNISFFSLILIFVFYYIDYSFKIANMMKGMEINENWRSALDFIKNNSDENTLVATWWDPGHIIAGYARVKVHADGAHCGWSACIPYNHDIRIQDMGRILTTSNENEAYEILKKYTRISEEDCKKVKESFPNLFDEKICNITINKIYFIASQDLIFKYYWPYYFSSCLRKYYPDNSICYNKNIIENFFYRNREAEGYMYSVFVLNLQKSDINRGILVYSSQAYIGGMLREIDITVKSDIVDNTTVLTAYFMNRERIRYLVYYQGDDPIIVDQQTFNRKYDVNAMLIIDQSLRFAFLADEKLMNSMFTKMYFLNGFGLEKFKLVFNNPEVKIYEVVLS